MLNITVCSICSFIRNLCYIFWSTLDREFPPIQKALIYGLVTLALTPLFFYKYYDFFKQVVMDAMGGEFVGEQWIVPIGLSFSHFRL